jgi:TET-associated glycosyltransferase-like protein
MQIVIPTRGRIDQQITLQQLPRELRKRTTLVCPEEEALPLACCWNDVGIVPQPDPTMTIARKRGWIMREWLRCGYDKVLMLDDDLSFATRISETNRRLRPIHGEEFDAEIQRLEQKLGPEFPHVGFGPRQGNHLKEAGWQTPDRMMCSLAYYLPIVVKECDLGRIETREDMDVSLQLLRKGYRNAVWHTTVSDQKFDAPGGCRLWRTIEHSNADAYKLSQLHPGYVSVAERGYKASVPRKEVICQWQKALADGLRSIAS